MIKYREILRLYSQGVSQRGIASSCQCSRNTVSKVLERAGGQGIAWPFEKDMTDADLQGLLFPEKSIQSNRKLPDCAYIHREMAKSGVTLSLLWHEYCEQCRLNGDIPLMYSQFCRYYREYANTTKATMRIKRKPGEMMEVDWAGKTAFITDNVTGEPIPAYIFVAVLSCSQYLCGSFPDHEHGKLDHAYVNTFNYFGGVTDLVPDNLKTSVDKVSRPDPRSTRPITRWPSITALLLSCPGETPQG